MLKLVFLSFPPLGSRMGQWDHCMHLQTLNTSVPVMVSTSSFFVGSQDFALDFLCHNVNIISEGWLASQGEGKNISKRLRETPLSAEHACLPLLQRLCYYGI